MLVTVTNALATSINYLAVAEDGVATGGARVRPLPYPFSHIGTVLAAGTKQLPMHPADWRRKACMGEAMEPAYVWNQLTQAGVVTLAIAAETGRQDNEELYEDAI